MFGGERASIINKPMSVFMSLEHSLSFFGHIKSVLSSLKKESVYLQVQSKNKQMLHIQLESILHESLENKKVIQSAIIDISERVNAEQEKKEADRQMRAIIEALPAFVFIIDNNGRYLYSNTAHDNFF